MAAIAANIRIVTATISIGTDDYTAHIQDYSIDPTPVTAEFTDVSGKTTRLAGQSAWNVTLNVAQDFGATGLARKMFTDEGSNVVLKIVDGPTTWTQTVTLVAPKIGGATKAVGVSTVVLPCTGRPVPTVSV
ncbi:hypothetical protein [Microbacterium sp. LWH10-1.2]|uniref:hypothetical protein n=1 Tax=Microbacterium sp. LWH10-1.2 TaxID=3135255 RepID=UPI003139F8D0